MLKYSNGKYNCYDDINCNDSALQKCRYFRGIYWSGWCDDCENKDACWDIWRQRIAAQKQAELMAIRHAVSPHGLYFY